MTAPTPDSSPQAADTASVSRIAVADARALVDTGRAVFVDVRSRHLYDNAHIPGAVSVPLAQIQAASGNLSATAVPPDRLIILYCA